MPARRVVGGSQAWAGAERRGALVFLLKTLQLEA